MQALQCAELEEREGASLIFGQKIGSLACVQEPFIQALLQADVTYLPGPNLLCCHTSPLYANMIVVHYISYEVLSVQNLVNEEKAELSVKLGATKLQQICNLCQILVLICKWNTSC